MCGVASLSCWCGCSLLRLPADMATGDELLKAAERGDVEEVRRLLNAGVDVNSEDRCGRTALLAAALARAVQTSEFRASLADMLACELDNVSGPASPLTALARQLCAAAKDDGGAREPAAAGAPKRRRVGPA